MILKYKGVQKYIFMKITLKKKKLKSNRQSLYIEYYKGSTTTPEGKRKHLRDFEYLDLYIILKAKTTKEKQDNKETLELAENILSIRKAEHLQGKYQIRNTKRKKIRFLDYYDKLKEARYESKGNYDNWDAAGIHLNNYCPINLTFEEVDENFIKGYRKYLDTEAKTKGGTPLSQNTKYTYFNKFRACLKKAFEDNYLDTNLRKHAKAFKMGESQREYLTFDEVQALSNAKCKYDILKRAFLFSCVSGLRWSDINSLTWGDVRDENQGSRIIFRQQKTDGLEYLDISVQARELLKGRKNNSDRVFTGLKYGAHFNAEILRWCMRAGITKHITFHSARHTNAVLLLENGADIYTVSKRLGHRELRTTEIYTKIIDKKMKEASELIPKLNLSL